MIGVGFNQIVFARGFPRLKLFDPGMLARNMVDDQVHHQVELVGNVLDIFPTAQGGIDLVVVDDGKAIVGAIGKKGQDMDPGDGVLQMGVEEVG